MASRAFSEVLGIAVAAIRAEDGSALARLFSLNSASLPGGAALTAALQGGRTAISAAVNAVFNENAADARVKRWFRVFSEHLTAVAALAKNDVEAAFEAEHTCLIEFLQFVNESNTNWLVPPLHVLVANARSLSVALTHRMAARGARDAAAGKINALATTLRNAFSYTVNHRLPRELIAQSKKWGALAVVNVLFRMYFKLNQLRQCKFFIAAVEGPGFPPLEQFPVSQVVTYRYYTGRLAMFDDNFGRANSALTYAAAHCHAGYTSNRRRILEALIPVRMALGELPTPALLRTHGLDQYAGVTDALREGNVGAYVAQLEAHQEAFIKAGVYLLLERLQLAVYRTLFKRVASIATTSRLPLALLQAGLAASGVKMDIAEVECIVANLVAGKYIRGYLSHKPPFLVVAKEKAFRPLTEVAALASSSSAVE